MNFKKGAYRIKTAKGTLLLYVNKNNAKETEIIVFIATGHKKRDGFYPLFKWDTAENKYQKYARKLYKQCLPVNILRKI